MITREQVQTFVEMAPRVGELVHALFEQEYRRNRHLRSYEQTLRSWQISDGQLYITLGHVLSQTTMTIPVERLLDAASAVKSA